MYKASQQQILKDLHEDKPKVFFIETLEFRIKKI